MRTPLLPHASRLAGWLLLLVTLGGTDSDPQLALTAVLATLVFLASFALFHDAAHGSLGLPARVNEALLCVLAPSLLMSTHAQRQLHLRHHARPLAADDVEGIAARRRFVPALVTAPLLAGVGVAAGVRAVACARRGVVFAELAVVAAVAGVAVWQPTSAFGVYVAVACALQLTMAFWASHLPHNPPALVSALARRAATLGSPALLAFAYHREHHAQPRLPCARLRSERRA